MKRIILLFFILFLLTPTFSYATNQLGWSSAQQDAWTYMKNTNDPVYQKLLLHANASGLSGDAGYYDGLMYMITGNTQYATNAWSHFKGLPGNYTQAVSGCTPGAKLRGLNTYNTSGGCSKPDDRRDIFPKAALLYSWIADALPAQDKANFADILDMLAYNALDIDINGVNFNYAPRPRDSDQAVGDYFGLVIYALAIRDENVSKSNTFLNATDSTGKSVGGVDSTGANTSTWRNNMSRFISFATGGQWIESSQYNLLTVSYLITGIEAINDYYGSDKFPEVNDLYDDFATSMIDELTPNLTDSYKWGDYQTAPRGLLDYRRVQMYTCIAYVTNSPEMWYMVDQMNSSMGTGSNPTYYVDPYFFYFYDPRPTRTRPSGIRYSNAGSDIVGNYGRGISFYHYGGSTWTNQDTFFASSMFNNSRVDHEDENLSDFEWWRKGGYFMTKPRLYYGHYYYFTHFHNTMQVSGFYGASWMQKGQYASHFANDYVYHVGGTYGFPYALDGSIYQPPPTSIREWTRSHLFYHDTSSGDDTLFIFDRLNFRDPRTLWRSANYRPDHLKKINSMNATNQIIFNTENPVTVNGNRGTFTARNGETGYLDWYIESGAFSTVNISNTSNSGSPYYFQTTATNTDEQNDNQFRIQPTERGANGWVNDCYMEIVHAGSSPSTPSYITGSSVAGEDARGVYYQYGTKNILAVFNCEPDTAYPAHDDTYQNPSGEFTRASKYRFFENSFELSFTADGLVDVFIGDLHSDKTWTVKYQIGTGAPTTVGTSPDDSGILRFSVNAGNNTVKIQAVSSGAQPPACSNSPSLCVNQTDCETAGYYWDSVDSECLTDNTCVSSKPHLCTTQGDCEGVGLYWYDSQCNLTQEASACDSVDWTGCTTQQTCEAAGWHWYLDQCNQVELPSTQVGIILEPVKDTYVNGGTSADTNFDTQQLVIKSSTSDSTSRVALESYFINIPQGSTIVSATLKATATSSQSLEFNKRINVFELLRDDWSEGQATWNQYKSGSSWTTAGVRGNGTDINGDWTGASGGELAYLTQQTSEPGTQVTYVSNPSLLTLVQNRIGLNLNLVFHQKENDESFIKYYDSEDSISGVRPKLYLIYETPKADPKTIFGSCTLGSFGVNE